MRGDPFLLAQAIGNLIDNAIKYTPPAGSIHVRIERDANGEIAMTVADTGPGIIDVEKARVTERFYRGDTSRGTAGWGLDLAWWSPSRGCTAAL